MLKTKNERLAVVLVALATLFYLVIASIFGWSGALAFICWSILLIIGTFLLAALILWVTVWVMDGK